MAKKMKQKFLPEMKSIIPKTKVVLFAEGFKRDPVSQKRFKAEMGDRGAQLQRLAKTRKAKEFQATGRQAEAQRTKEIQADPGFKAIMKKRK